MSVCVCGERDAQGEELPFIAVVVPLETDCRVNTASEQLVTRIGQLARVGASRGSKLAKEGLHASLPKLNTRDRHPTVDQVA